MSARKKKEVREVHVVLDTNTVHVDAADALLNQPVANLIEQSRGYNDLHLHWYLPAVVIGERRYRMYEKARSLLSPARKLERLTGKKFGFTDQVLQDRVDHVIADQIQRLGIQELPLDYNEVDWGQILDCAIARKPPFEAGDKEKGFRDALVIEAFLQLGSRLNLRPAMCWIALVSSDKLVARAVEGKEAQPSTLRMLKSFEELVTLINSFRSEVPEGLLPGLVRRAQEIFFGINDQGSLFYRERVVDQIEQRFGNILRQVPPDCSAPSMRKVVVGQPKLLSKRRQQIRWSNKVRIVMEARKTDAPRTLAEAIMPSGTASVESSSTMLRPASIEPESSVQALGTDEASLADLFVERLLGIPLYKRIGSHSFEVVWQLTFATSGQMIKPRVIDYQYLATTWKLPQSV